MRVIRRRCRKKVNPFQKEESPPLGYRQFEHGEFCWRANAEGERFLLRVDDWSPDKLASLEGWKCRNKGEHAIYLVRPIEGPAYLIKDYPSAKKSRFVLGQECNRAKKEFSNTLLAHRKGIATVLPLAFGEVKSDRQRGIIIYPFLEDATPLERIYEAENWRSFGIRKRQDLEKAAGKLLRAMNDAGAYPVDGHLDHFLARKSDTGVLVYYIDLERIEFRPGPRGWLRKINRIKTLGKLLARLEWLRVSNRRVSRPSMMRVSHAFFRVETLGRLDRGLCRKVIRAATKYWYRREFDRRGVYQARSFSSLG